MGYESLFKSEFSNDAEFRDLEELNEKISELDDNMSEAVVKKLFEKSDSTSYYDIDMDGYDYGKFDNYEDFANLLSEYLIKGKVNLIWVGEDGETEAIMVTPNEITYLTNILVPDYMVNDVEKYINEYKKK